MHTTQKGSLCSIITISWRSIKIEIFFWWVRNCWNWGLYIQNIDQPCSYVSLYYIFIDRHSFRSEAFPERRVLWCIVWFYLSTASFVPRVPSRADSSVKEAEFRNLVQVSHSKSRNQVLFEKTRNLKVNYELWFFHLCWRDPVNLASTPEGPHSLKIKIHIQELLQSINKLDRIINTFITINQLNNFNHFTT